MGLWTRLLWAPTDWLLAGVSWRASPRPACSRVSNQEAWAPSSNQIAARMAHRILRHQGRCSAARALAGTTVSIGTPQSMACKGGACIGTSQGMPCKGGAHTGGAAPAAGLRAGSTLPFLEPRNLLPMLTASGGAAARCLFCMRGIDSPAGTAPWALVPVMPCAALGTGFSIGCGGGGTG